jgi:hypothetical protein
MVGPEGILRGVRWPVAKILTFVPPMSTTNTVFARWSV